MAILLMRLLFLPNPIPGHEGKDAATGEKIRSPLKGGSENL